MHVYTIRAKITLNPTRQHKLSQKVRGEHPLQKMGYKNVVSVDGGWRGWTGAGFPVEKPVV
jgi:3-mercaptopyruvate sulfurtransferase SseA